MPSEATAARLVGVLGGTTEDYHREEREPVERPDEIKRLRAQNRELAQRLEDLEVMVADFITVRNGKPGDTEGMGE